MILKQSYGRSWGGSCRDGGLDVLVGYLDCEPDLGSTDLNVGQALDTCESVRVYYGIRYRRVPCF